MNKKILLTGGAGFVGHHLVDYLLTKTDFDIVLLDRLDLSGNLNRLTELDSVKENVKRLKFLYHDLRSPINEYIERQVDGPNYILHLAASTHVDRSISDPMLFAQDNVLGMVNVLEYARRCKDTLEMLVNFSTDEVFGPAPLGRVFKETDAFHPSNPYAATKAAAVELCRAWHVTYGVPTVNTYTVNNFGERQHPEKLIPKTIRSILEQTSMPIFAEIGKDNKMKAVGSRFWIHCQNTASAVLFVLNHGVPGQDYNIATRDERTNLEVSELIAKFVGLPLRPEFVDFHKARPGHDRRYGLDATRILDMGWKPEMTFEESLKRVVEFTIRNPKWS